MGSQERSVDKSIHINEEYSSGVSILHSGAEEPKPGHCCAIIERDSEFWLASDDSEWTIVPDERLAEILAMEITVIMYGKVNYDEILSRVINIYSAVLEYQKL